MEAEQESSSPTATTTSKKRRRPARQSRRPAVAAANQKDAGLAQQEVVLQPRKRKQRKRSKQRSAGTATTTSSTELTAAGHILADQVHDYLHNQTAQLSSGETLFLDSWVDAAQTKLQMQSTCFLDNVQVVQDWKETTNQVQEVRDELVVLRALTKNLQSETKQLQSQAERSKELAAARRGASEFLRAVETIAGDAVSSRSSL